MHYSLLPYESQRLLHHKYCIFVQVNESKFIYLHKAFGMNVFLFTAPLLYKLIKNGFLTIIRMTESLNNESSSVWHAISGESKG
jgi:hypothetical protein